MVTDLPPPELEDPPPPPPLSPPHAATPVPRATTRQPHSAIQRPCKKVPPQGIVQPNSAHPMRGVRWIAIDSPAGMNPSGPYQWTTTKRRGGAPPCTPGAGRVR